MYRCHIQDMILVIQFSTPTSQDAPLWTDKHLYIQFTILLFLCTPIKGFQRFSLIERDHLSSSQNSLLLLSYVSGAIYPGCHFYLRAQFQKTKALAFVLHTLMFMSKRSDLSSMSTIPSDLKIEQPTRVLNQIITEIVWKMVLNYL